MLVNAKYESKITKHASTENQSRVDNENLSNCSILLKSGQLSQRNKTFHSFTEIIC